MDIKPLPVIAILNEAIGIVWRKRSSLFRALFFSGLALTVLDTVGDAIERSDWHLKALFLFLTSILFTLFAVTCHRIVLKGDASTPSCGIHTWSWRESRFLGWTLVGWFYFMLISLGLSMFAGILPAILLPHKDISPIFYFMWLPGTHVFARLSVLLPATAIDERRDINWAWNTTSGNGWRLVLIVALLPVASGVVLNLVELRQHELVEFVKSFLGYAVVAMEIAALSVSFKFLDQERTNKEDNSPPPPPC